MPWKPDHAGEFPTLGWLCLDWVTAMLARPDSVDYQPLILTPEQAKFVLNFYRLDPETGRRVYRRAVWSRPKKHGKSPLMGAIGAFEALGPCLFDGWDADGKPVGRPWADVRTPLVQFAAVNEDQTRNAFDPLLEMLREGPAIDHYQIEPMQSAVVLPKGRIEFLTAAALSKEGARPVFCALDQTESWTPSNGGRKLADVLRRNLGPLGGTSIETPNAYRPGTDSVAEMTFKFAAMIEEGRARGDGLLVDHREAPADTVLSDRDSLLAGLAYAYGDSAKTAGGWVDLERVADEIWDPATDPQDARQFYLNQVTHAQDAWLSQPEWLACEDRGKTVEPDEPVVLGFDGSRGRMRGHADATALVAMRVSDKHIFDVRVWESNGEPDWQPNIALVDRTIKEFFEEFNVVGFYADPSGWQSQVAEWEAIFTPRLKIRATQTQPIAMWPRGKNSQVAHLTGQFYAAVVSGDITHNGSAALMRHVLNARRRQSRGGGYLLYKEFPESPNKIDAAYAAMLAFRAALDAQTRGFGVAAQRKPRRKRKVLMG